MTAAPSQPAHARQDPAQGPRPLFTPIRLIRAAAALQTGPSAKHVLVAMAAYVDFRTGDTRVSTTTLAADTGLGYNTVARALDELEAAGILTQTAPAKGRRAATFTLDSRSLHGDPADGSTENLEAPPQGPNAPDIIARLPKVGTQATPVDPPPRGPKPVGSPSEARRVPTVGTNQYDQKTKAAPSDARVREAAGGGAAAESREGSPSPAASPATENPASPARTAPEGPRVSDVALPPLSPTNAPQGHVAGLAGTPWGQRLLGMLKDAGVLARDLWSFARRVDFDYDLVAYVVHRAKECRPKAHDGTTESPTAHASRRAGLLRILAREPREGLAGWQGFTQQRQANRTAAVTAVWAWVRNTRPAAPEQDAVVAAWGERHDLMTAGPAEWARHLPVVDLDLYPARLGAAGCAKAWDAIVAGIKEQTP